MINPIGRIAGRACTSMLSTAGKRFSKTACIIVGAAAGAGITVLIVKKGGKIWDKLPTVFDPRTGKTFSPDDSSCKGRTSEGNGCHTNVYTTVYVNQINVTNNIVNVTNNTAYYNTENIMNATAFSEERPPFSDGSHAKTAREPSSEYTSTVSGPFTSQEYTGTVSPLSSGNPASGGAFSGKRQPVESSVAFSASTFCLSLDEGVIKELFDKMHGKYFHKRTSLEQFTYVLTGRGEKPKSDIPIEWIASPRSFALFIGIVCASCYKRWKKGASLFCGRINKNPSCDFNRMVKQNFVKNNKVSPALEDNTDFKSEEDNDLKSLLVLLSGFPTF